MISLYFWRPFGTSVRQRVKALDIYCVEHQRVLDIKTTAIRM
jgi:hypothetical protein